MIAASELRIGNWVKHGESPSTFAYPNDIFQVSLDLFFDMARSRVSDWNLDPIPLTHKILKSVGINEKNDNKYFWEGKFELSPFIVYTFHFQKSQSNLTVGIQTYDNQEHPNGCINVAWGIKSLHQLQNLYFALTNSELTYKPMKLKN